MFRKTLKIKSNTQMRTSDKRKLIKRIYAMFPGLDLVEETLFTSREPVFVIRGHNLLGEPFNIYSSDTRPYVFEIGCQLFPTVFLFWRFPQAVEIVTTNNYVKDKVIGGADLMVPGICYPRVSDCIALSKFKMTEAVGINVLDNSAVFAVGALSMGGMDIKNSHGHGRFVKVHHTFGDELCRLASETPTLPLSGPVIPPVDPASASTNQFLRELDPASLEQRVFQGYRPTPSPDQEFDQSAFPPPISFEETMCPVFHPLIFAHQPGSPPSSLPSSPVDSSKNIHAPKSPVTVAPVAAKSPTQRRKRVPNKPSPVQEAPKTKVHPATAPVKRDAPQNVTSATPQPERPKTLPETVEINMDELLQYCFFKAIKGRLIELPILANLLYKKHILQVVPRTMKLDVKKTTFKKLSVFLKSLEEEGMIKLSVRDGVHSLEEVNYGHPTIRGFNDPDAAAETPLTEPTELEIHEDYVLNNNTMPLFIKDNFKKGQTVTGEEVREFVRNYVKRNKLQDAAFPEYVILNGTLCDVLKIRDERLKWPELYKKLFALMGNCYTVRTPNGQTLSARGKLPRIDITTGTRTGNKKVTLVNHIEAYGLNITEIQRKCQRALSVSTTTYQIPGFKSLQLLIQGNQCDYISELLHVDYKIPKQYIKGFVEKKKKEEKKKDSPSQSK